ncbi:MAG: putative ABC transport system permease protein, partial [Cyclobacteriaceae bacterium]
TQSLESIRETYSQFNPGFVFEYEFMDQVYARMYESEQRVSTLSKYFAGFAILISCLGLFGLAAFTAERRIKEIGIRKVLGASIVNLMILLTKDFAKLVLTAILIALPIAYWVTRNWLEGFAFHIDLSIWFFVVAGLMALIIALLTVSSQAYKAASVNPSECLKDE